MGNMAVMIVTAVEVLSIMAGMLIIVVIAHS